MSSSSASFDSEDSDEPSRLLVICIDRDNDIGVKTGLQTPIVGKDACLDAATKLAIADPEEADANAIFAAVKEYDELLKKGEICEVVVVGGLFERGTLGDKKIRKEIADTLKGYPADGAVLVSDGNEGEEMVPVIQNLVPIVSIKRVIIKHSKSVEESYAVLGRYFKMLLFDPRYARYALGVPGIIFIGIVLIYVVDQQAAALVLPIFVGIVFIIRGFDIDRKIEAIGHLSPTGFLRFFSTTASILIILVGIASGIAIFFVPCGSTPLSDPCLIAKNVGVNQQTIVLYAPKIIGYFIQNSQLYVWLGFAVYITTSIFFNVIRPKSRHVARYVIELFVLGLLYLPVSIFADTLITPSKSTDLFIAIVMFALAVNFTIAAYLYHYISNRRKETQDIEV